MSAPADGIKAKPVHIRAFSVKAEAGLDLPRGTWLDISAPHIDVRDDRRNTKWPSQRAAMDA
jgi:hypothetical protein